MKFLKGRFSKERFWRFFLSYVIAEASAYGCYIVPMLFIQPWFMVLFPTNSEKGMLALFLYALFTSILMTVVFYGIFAYAHLYRNKEVRLQYYKATVSDTSLKSRTKYYMAEYGVADIVYYSIISILPRILSGGPTMESILYFGLLPILLEHLITSILFAGLYACCVMIVTGIWEKKRPAYLTEGYTGEIPSA